MGHSCEILHFDVSKYNKEQIESECNRWANYNCDRYESGLTSGLGSKIQFTSQVFESIEAADEYLITTFGNYRQIAVRAKVYKDVPITKAQQDLQRRCAEYRKRIDELNKPHYAGVQSSTVKCKKCGAVLPTAYCGKSWYNTCPVCKVDMRPATTLEKLETYKKKLRDLELKLMNVRVTDAQKMKKQAEMFWCVACEVHC